MSAFLSLAYRLLVAVVWGFVVSFIVRMIYRLVERKHQGPLVIVEESPIL